MPTRDRLLELLHWGPLTVDQLAGEVGLTLNGVRAQLTAMERDGLVERTGVRLPGKVGKPPTVFGLTHSAREERSTAYPAALTALVSELVARRGPEDAHGMLNAAGIRLAAGHNKGRDAVQVLQELGAVVRRSRDTQGRELVEGAGCPLATAVQAEPVTCELVRSLLSASIGKPVEMCCRHGDAPACRFVIDAPDKPGAEDRS
ncbi:MAG: hypothetical protein R3B35_02915 [Gemmatimonadales bacterium]